MADFPAFTRDLSPEDAPTYKQVNGVFIKQFTDNIERVNSILTVEECTGTDNEKYKASHKAVFNYDQLLREFSMNYFKLSISKQHGFMSDGVGLGLYVEKILKFEVPMELLALANDGINGTITLGPDGKPILSGVFNSDEVQRVITTDHESVLNSLQSLTKNILRVNGINIGK